MAISSNSFPPDVPKADDEAREAVGASVSSLRGKAAEFAGKASETVKGGYERAREAWARVFSQVRLGPGQLEFERFGTRAGLDEMAKIRAFELKDKLSTEPVEVPDDPEFHAKILQAEAEAKAAAAAAAAHH